MFFNTAASETALPGGTNISWSEEAYLGIEVSIEGVESFNTI